MTASLLVFLGRRDGEVSRGSPPGRADGCQHSADDPTPRVSHAHAPHALSVNPGHFTLSGISTLGAMPETSADLAHLRLERPSEGVVLLTLDNPGMRNAMSDEMTSSWVAAIDQVAADPSVRAVVVTGEGSAFCSGGNTSWIASEPDASVDRLRSRMLPFYRAWLSIRRLEVPTIAAVNGAAIGAGLCLALACDIRYAAAGA